MFMKYIRTTDETMQQILLANEFLDENANVQNTAYNTRDQLIQNINRNQPASITASDDGDINKGRLYGLIYTLYAVSHMIFRRKRLAVAITDSITGEQNFFAININTIDMLKELVRFMILEIIAISKISLNLRPIYYSH